MILGSFILSEVFCSLAKQILLFFEGRGGQDLAGGGGREEGRGDPPLLAPQISTEAGSKCHCMPIVTDKQRDGHCDSMTKMTQWANLMKSEDYAA